MNWIKLEHLLLKAQAERAVTAAPALSYTDHLLQWADFAGDCACTTPVP